MTARVHRLETRRNHVLSRRLGLALALLAGLTTAACNRQSAEAPAAPAGPAVVELGLENIVTVERQTILVGPLISGQLGPLREATVRAEIGGSILRVGPEEGQSVSAGTLLAVIEAKAQNDAVASAQSQLRSAEHALEVVTRELQRSERLLAAGAIAERDVDLARNTVTATEAQVADARARLISAQKTLGDTTVRAPMTGIVSRRAVSAGDVVSPGTELYTIIDPSSMLLEASVPSAELASLRVNTPVSFEVRGYPGQSFDGRIARISPVADPITRQVPIFVDIPNKGSRLVAGLFAEGRIARESREGLVVPVGAVNETGARPWVLRLRSDMAERVEVELGLRDERTERVEIRSGVEAGDQLLVGAARGISPGTPVRVRREQTEN